MSGPNGFAYPVKPSAARRAGDMYGAGTQCVNDRDVTTPVPYYQYPSTHTDCPGDATNTTYPCRQTYTGDSPRMADQAATNWVAPPATAPCTPKPYVAAPAATTHRQDNTANPLLASKSAATQQRTPNNAAAATQPKLGTPMHKWRVAAACISKALFDVTTFALCIAAYMHRYHSTTYAGTIMPTPGVSQNAQQYLCRDKCASLDQRVFAEALNNVKYLSSGTTGVDEMVNQLFVHAATYTVSGCQVLSSKLLALNITPADNAAGTSFIAKVNCVFPDTPIVLYLYSLNYQGGLGFIISADGRRIDMRDYIVDTRYKPFATAILAIGVTTGVVSIATLILVLCSKRTAHGLYRYTGRIRGVLSISCVLSVVMIILVSAFLGIRANMNIASPTPAVQSIVTHMLSSSIAMHAVILAFGVVGAIIGCVTLIAF